MVTKYLRRGYSTFATHVLDIPPRLLAFLLLILLSFLPITRPGLYILFMLSLANLTAIIVASWDLLTRAGQMSLGHALFFGLGAYGSALMYKYYHLPIWATIPVGVLIGVIAALVLGIPCLRVKGPFLAIVTMTAPLIVIGIFFFFSGIFGGEYGVAGLPRFFELKFFTERGLPYTEARYMQQVADYYISLLVLFVSATILYKVATSRTGIVFVSILDDELASKACGINVTRYKLLAFVISAAFASLAGGVYAHFMTIAGPSTLAATLSFLVVLRAIMGGMATIYGPIVGTYIYALLSGYVLKITIHVPDEYHLFIFIAIVVIFIIFWPRGIGRFIVEDILGKASEKRELEERGKWIWKKYRKKKKKVASS